MALYVDAPSWPAHGTRFGHLVSDRDLRELHDFAAGLGLPVRAFELDHYDLPEHLWQPAVDAGARPVTRPELLRALTAGGLRVRGRDRPAALRRRRDADLARRWRRLGARLPVARPAGWAALGAELLDRWDEPHRGYHASGHLADVLDRLDRLTGDEPGGPPARGRGEPLLRHEEPRDGAVPPAVALAAWFHDAVHTGHTPQDETASADLAIDRLTALGLPDDAAQRVGELVLATAGHTGAGTDPGRHHDRLHDRRHDRAALLCDADLGILGAGERRYRAYAAGVRAEYPDVDDARFARGRAAVLRALLDRPRLFVTHAAHAWWERPARANLSAELAELAELAEPADAQR